MFDHKPFNINRRPDIPKQRWYHAYRLFRSQHLNHDLYPKWIWNDNFYPAYWNAKSKYPQDPLTVSIKKRLSFYKYIKKGPNPEIPF